MTSLALNSFVGVVLLSILHVHSVSVDDSRTRAEAFRGDDAESANRLKNSQALFDDASSQKDTIEERALKTKLASAMSLPAQLGTPTHDMPLRPGLGCQSDMTSCPLGWQRKGVMCFADANYSGPCASFHDLSDMSAEEKLAFAQQCGITFPCQGECDLNFESACPSAWRQNGQGACSAPSNYAGKCSPHLDVLSMTIEDKQMFGVQCGARWPCLPQGKHEYSSVCPQGWILQSGQVCNAPLGYSGPCDKVAYMTGMTVRGKKEFEASCEVDWPAAKRDCVRNYTAPCPLGWAHVASAEGDVECHAPTTYRDCNVVQYFGDMSPAEKNDWERLCNAPFPCNA
jgi:CPW-WPC domain-containing protein